MRTILKYRLTQARMQTIPMPESAQVLCVQAQDGVLMVWALVDTSDLMEKRVFYVVGTGEDATELFSERVVKHVGTVQLHGAEFVVHIFEDQGRRR